MLATAPSTSAGMWPDGPPCASREAGCAGPAGGQAFPSGRAALAACLRAIGVEPWSVVATPECITGCVANALRPYARPMPLRAALAGQQTPAAVVVYEQWGWPLPPAAEDELLTRLSAVPVVVDRVDSADFFAEPRRFGQFEVLSLSKTLGLPTGGLARRLADATYLRFESSGSSKGVDDPARLAHPAVRELLKQSQSVHPAVVAWLAANCSVRAAEAERLARNSAARTLVTSQFGADWPTWMKRAIEAGAGPVWAPLLRGCSPEIHWRALAHLARAGGVAAAGRAFNWTGNPLAPAFEPCVALPIHSGVKGVADVVSELARIVAPS